MKYFSTRNRNIVKSGSEAVVEGIAADGGLFLPEEFPCFPMETLAELTNTEISTKVLSLLLEEFSEEELTDSIEKAYASFEEGNIAPLKTVGGDYLLELWHGPTAAFKDVALQLLPYLLTASAEKCGITDEIAILTATSGDTGSAALKGFSGVKGTSVTVFYPYGAISPMQEKQMVTCDGDNTAVCAIRGNFDDAQSGVKRIFATLTPPVGKRLSSANSINIGRLAPQIAYYFTAYRDLWKSGAIAFGEAVNFVVPTGNFGDILAGYFAKKMGLYVGQLVSASNKNSVLCDFFKTGLYDKRREFYVTSSPSMDILISSNLERLLAIKFGCERTAELMKSLNEKGHYRLTSEELAALSEEFEGAWIDEEETLETIKTVFEKEGYLLDPHTAVAYAAKERLALDGVTVVLSTASPYKFTKQVLQALGERTTGDDFDDLSKLYALSKMPIPKALSSLKTATSYHKAVVDIKDMDDFVMKTLEVKV